MTTPNIPPRWYVLTADGLATLCADQADAIETARQADIAWPNNAPHVAVQLAPAQPAMPKDAEASEWMGCESRRPYVVNSLKSRIRDLRNTERRCRTAFRKDFMGQPSQYLADALGEAAAALESRLSAIDARRRIEGE